MQSNTIRSLMLTIAILSIVTSACSAAREGPASPTPERAPLIPIAGSLATATIPATQVPPTSTVPVAHVMMPADPKGGKLVYDIESVGTAPEKRAPYGDSYNINRLERPFRPDMGYAPDVDIADFIVTSNNDWWYVSIEIIGSNPNHPAAINYGVELDLDRNGYGDYLIWAHPPYTDQWQTDPVQIYEDRNHNTGGVSAGKSDAPFSTDGYETLIFDGSTGGADPDLAWVRIKNVEAEVSVQFAFKKSWSGSVFMLGVIADAGWKDPKKLDYVDRLPIEEAGSPVKENKYYPLKELFLVDNTCREAFGFEPTRYEPQICPVPVPPTKTPGPSIPDVSQPGADPACQPPAVMQCPNGWDPVKCRCN